MKKIIWVIIIIMTLCLNLNVENEPDLLIFENIEALAYGESSNSGLRGTCLGKVGPCISYCPSCSRFITGTSGLNGPLENIHGTCICGQQF